MKRLIGMLGLIGIIGFSLELAAKDDIKGELEMSPFYTELAKSVYYAYKDESREGGGTAFGITAPNGRTKVISNAHVCGDSLYVYLGQDGSKILQKARVLRKDPVHDLCEIEAPRSVKPLRLATTRPKQFDPIVAIGHPYLESISPSFGIILEIKEAFIEQKGTNCGFENEVLSNKTEGTCLVSHHGYFSNMLIMPGNSGSPVLNSDGEVVAVAFIAGPTGSINITLEDLTRFLKQV